MQNQTPPRQKQAAAVQYVSCANLGASKPAEGLLECDRYFSPELRQQNCQNKCGHSSKHPCRQARGSRQIVCTGSCSCSSGQAKDKSQNTEQPIKAYQLLVGVILCCLALANCRYDWALHPLSLHLGHCPGPQLLPRVPFCRYRCEVQLLLTNL